LTALSSAVSSSGAACKTLSGGWSFAMNNRTCLLLLALASIATGTLFAQATQPISAGTYFPPPGESLDNQARRKPAEVGMDDSFIAGINPFVTNRWALWRDGYLLHVRGDFNQKVDVA
jgi:hypothetical protein